MNDDATQTAITEPEAPQPRVSLWLVMQAGEALLALPAVHVAAVRDCSPPHRLPRQGEGALRGALGWMGELAPCVCLVSAMGAVRCGTPKHTVFVRLEGALWALLVDRAARMIEVAEGEPTGELVWRGQPVKALDLGDLAATLREALR